MKYIRYSLFLRGINISFRLFEPKVVCFAILLSTSYLFQSDGLRASIVFPLIAFVNVVTGIVTYFFTQAFTNMAEVLVAIRRLEKILMFDEHEHIKKNFSKTSISSHQFGKVFKYT